jgi:hypothetical protein
MSDSTHIFIFTRDSCHVSSLEGVRELFLLLQKSANKIAETRSRAIFITFMVVSCDYISKSTAFCCDR